MKKLVIVRHASCDIVVGGFEGLDAHINKEGRARMKFLAKELKQYLNNTKILIISSPKIRARDSAEILANEFNATFEMDEILWSEFNRAEDLPAALELIRENKDKAETLILVTHTEYGRKLPSYFGREEFGVSWPNEKIQKGEAWLIDCENKTLKKFAL